MLNECTVILNALWVYTCLSKMLTTVYIYIYMYKQNITQPDLRVYSQCNIFTYFVNFTYLKQVQTTTVNEDVFEKCS